MQFRNLRLWGKEHVQDVDHNFFAYLYSIGYKNKTASGLDHDGRKWSGDFIPVTELGESYNIMAWWNDDWMFVFVVEQMDKRRIRIWR